MAAQVSVDVLCARRDGALQGVLTAADIGRNVESYMDKEMRTITGYLWAPHYPPEDS